MRCQTMKVAFIVNRFPSISETFILSQITGLINENIEVEIIAKNRSNGVKHREVDEYNLLEKCFYLEEAGYKPKNKLKRFCKAFKMLAKAKSNRAVLLKSLNVFKYGIDALSLNLLYKTERLLSKENCMYDIVLCHFGVNGELAVKLRDIGVIKGKVVTVFHGYDITSYIKDRGENVYNRLFEKGELFLPISANWANRLERLGCSKERIRVHRMGVDIERFQFSVLSYHKGKKLRIVSVARLVEKKGIEYGVQAVIRAMEIFPDIEYRIIGDGPLNDKLNEIIEKHNLSQSIILEGTKNQDAVIEILKNHADLLLMPSITAENGDQEGIPVVLMEALAVGLPVIATSHSGIPEIIKDNITGYLVPEKDVEALRKCILDFTNNVELNKKISLEGRKLVENDYNTKMQNKRLIGILTSLIENANEKELNSVEL